MANPVEVWKAQKHGLDAWADVLRYADARTSMKDIPAADLERMKWHGVFYRKRDGQGTYMLRLRVTGCELTAAQAKAVAYVALEHGYGIVDVTTRANLQVQGLSIENVPRAIERLAAVGLSCKQTGHDNVRNVFGHPFAGLDPEELLDTRELCRELTGIFLDRRDLSNLPRKFNIAVCGRPSHSIPYWTQDLSFLATRNDAGAAGFMVLLGGKQGQHPRLGRPLPVFLEPEKAPPLTQAILELFNEQGSREKRDAARFGLLLDRLGVEGLLAELEKRLGFPLERWHREPAPPAGYEDLVGWFPQKQPGRWTMGLCPPLGRLTWRQLEGLALASQRWGEGELRTTVEQGIAIVGVPTGFRDAAATEAAQVGLSVHADSLVRSFVACTGKQFCNIAVTETKGQALKLIEQLRQRSLALHGIRIHMSGCPSGCGNHHTADIGLKGVRVKRLIGTREGFDVFLGGGVAGRLHLGLPYRLGVDVGQLPQLVEEVVREYYLRHQPGQTFSSYWRDRLRDAAPAAVAEGDYAAAVWECENCRHEHVGEDPPIFCPKCAALRRQFARLEERLRGPEPPAPIERADDGSAVIGDVASFPEGAGRLVKVDGREIAVFRLGESIFALDNACPHMGGALSEGVVRDGVVACPLHGWTFDVRTGQGVEPASERVGCHPVRVDGGRVLVQLGLPAARGSAP